MHANSIIHQIIAIPRDHECCAHQPEPHRAGHPGRLIATPEQGEDPALREQDAGTAESGDQQGDGQTGRAQDEARAIGTSAGTEGV